MPNRSGISDTVLSPRRNKSTRSRVFRVIKVGWGCFSSAGRRWHNWPKCGAKIADHKLHGRNGSALDTALSRHGQRSPETTDDDGRKRGFHSRSLILSAASSFRVVTIGGASATVVLQKGLLCVGCEGKIREIVLDFLFIDRVFSFLFFFFV